MNHSLDDGADRATSAGDRIDFGDVPDRGFRPFLQQKTRAELLAHVAHLEGKLATLPAIEQAKGALMATYGISADAAFALLRFHSQSRNVKVRAIAAQLTILMCNTPSSSAAIRTFDRLLDDVAQSLQDHPPFSQEERRQVNPANEMTALSQQTMPNELVEMMLRSIATAPPGITIAANGPDVPLVYANNAFTEITGYPITDILGRNCRFLQGAGTESRSVARIRAALRTGRDVSVVLRNYRSDGVPFINEVSISPIRNRAQQITHFIGTQLDVTELANWQRNNRPFD